MTSKMFLIPDMIILTLLVTITRFHFCQLAFGKCLLAWRSIALVIYIHHIFVLQR